MRILFFLTIIFLTSGCSFQGPTISFNNLSDVVIKNIETRWGFERMDSITEILPGRRVIKSFPIYHGANFYGQVSISWENYNGEKFRKEFIFKEENLSKITTKTHQEVVIYFMQNGAKYYTSQDDDFQRSKRKRRDLMHEYWEDYKSRCKKDLNNC